MLIKRTPDRYEKLHILGGMATDDILTGGKVTTGTDRVAYSDLRKNPTAGVYRSSLPNGKKINLMRVMFTDFCMMDCAYCPNSIYVSRKRYAFKREELASTFMELQSRGTVDGDRRQLVLPVTSTIFAGRYGVIIRYGGTVDYRPTNQAIEAETYGRQDTGNGSGQGWDERAFSAQVAEWAIAVAGETGASVAHSAGSLRRGVGG